MKADFVQVFPEGYPLLIVLTFGYPNKVRFPETLRVIGRDKCNKNIVVESSTGDLCATKDLEEAFRFRGHIEVSVISSFGGWDR